MNIIDKKLRERYDEERRISNILRFFVGLFFGLSIGVLIGVLVAPKAGRDTIKDIKETSIGFKDDVIEKGKSMMPSKDEDDEE